MSNPLKILMKHQVFWDLFFCSFSSNIIHTVVLNLEHIAENEKKFFELNFKSSRNWSLDILLNLKFFINLLKKFSPQKLGQKLWKNHPVLWVMLAISAMLEDISLDLDSIIITIFPFVLIPQCGKTIISLTEKFREINC